MATSFNRSEYIQKLIKSGIEPNKAQEIADRTTYHPSSEAPALLGNPIGKLESGNAMAKSNKKTESKKRVAIDALAGQVDEVRQAALLKHTKQEIRDAQLSLFDIAPWADHMRALPNDYARSALFTVRNKRVPRSALQNEPIYSLGDDVNITYTGVELRAEDDELVWQQVMEYAKRSPIGDPISFTFYELCKDLGWSINGRYYKKAEECLSRLQASAMQFESKRVGRLESLSLISRFRVLDRGKKSSRCQVMIDEEMVVMFAGDYYSRFIWEKYKKLSPTARRMFDYFASHKQPFPLKLETFRLMCGSESTREKRWREQVRSACCELSESGLIAQAWVQNNQLYCNRV
ncbi:plasmid replication initiator TrfA [Marinobacter sp.]|uniref:plasmid replication initiator TrfA n=1 Tax=Marinobacter sp. TaxID=50741 RepID=UPI003A94AD66